MKRLLTFSLSVLIFACLMVASERRAWGYINPGDGLLALQGAASAVAAGLFFLRSKIKALFMRKPKADAAAKKPAAVVMPIKTDNRNAA